jgi:hypothetical protein
MELKAARILYLATSRFTYEYVERAFAQDTEAKRLMPAHVGGLAF